MSDDQAALEAVATIYYMDIKIRKALLTLCQAQSMPDPDTTVALRLAKVLQDRFEVSFVNSGLRYLTTLQKCVQPLRDYIQSPFLSGLISMLLRNIPYENLESVQETFEGGLSKEIGAAMEEFHPTLLNWNAVMSHNRFERRNQTFHSEYGKSAEIRDHIYHSLRSVIPKLVARPLYPVIGSKTIGHDAFEQLKDTYVGWRYEAEDITPQISMVERLYSLSGKMSGGVTELRWSWKYSQLKPRIYYARGPTVYHASKYIQPVYNLLVDCLSCTNRRERFDIRSFQLIQALRLFIYDYESFTSLFEEIKNFNLALAHFFRGILVTIIDTHLGPISVDLGEIFEHYHEVCSLYPEFDISSCNWERIRTETEYIVHTCGMLGVPGNISSCTLAHGIHLMLVLEDLGCKVVGDDAIGATLEGPEEVLEKLRNIGRIEETKLEMWQGEDKEPDEGLALHTWHYTKRPITRIGNRVIQGCQMIFPPIADFLDISDSFHTVKPHHDKAKFLEQRCNMLLSFVVQLRHFPDKPSGVELSVINKFYQHLRHMLYEEKHRIGNHTVNLHLLPSEIQLCFDFDEWFIEFGQTVTRVPKEVVGSLEFEKYGINCGPMTRSVNLAVKLGYAWSKAEMIEVVPEDNRDLFHRLLLKSDRIHASYTFQLDRSCPIWLVNLIESEYICPYDPYIQEEYLGILDEDSDVE